MKIYHSDWPLSCTPYMNPCNKLYNNNSNAKCEKPNPLKIGTNNGSEPEVKLSCVKQCCAVLCFVGTMIVQSHLSLDADQTNKQTNKQQVPLIALVSVVAGSWLCGQSLTFSGKTGDWGRWSQWILFVKINKAWGLTKVGLEQEPRNVSNLAYRRKETVINHRLWWPPDSLTHGLQILLAPFLNFKAQKKVLSDTSKTYNLLCV